MYAYPRGFTATQDCPYDQDVGVDGHVRRYTRPEKFEVRLELVCDREFLEALHAWMTGNGCTLPRPALPSAAPALGAGVVDGELVDP